VFYIYALPCCCFNSWPVINILLTNWLLWSLIYS
jgi:hypothetical protein